MDLVIVNPNARILAPLAAIEPPFWAGLMAHDCEAEILDAEAENLDISETYTRLSKMNPKKVILVAMGNNPSASSTPKMVVVEKLAKLLKDNVKTLITGLHPMALKELTEARTGCKVLDWHPDVSMVVPWEELPMDKYRAHNWHCLGKERSPYGVLYTSLGCPYSCSFCNIHTLYKGVEYRSLANIKFDAFIQVKQYGIKNIKIWDELFTFNPKHVEAICDYLITLEADLNIWAYARVGTVKPRMLAKMKQAGINWLAYGFESASPEVRGSKRFYNTEMDKTIKITQDAGINIMGNFIFGLPEDTMETMEQTLQTAMFYNFEFINFYVGMAYPGSQWFEEQEVKVLDWEAYNQYSPKCRPTGNKNLKPEDIVKFRDEAFHRYFSRTEYQDMIKSKFGDKAVAHIREMLEWRGR